MNIANFIITAILAYYFLYLFELILNKKERQKQQKKNIKLEKMRKIAIKSIKQQKEFINVKFPKTKIKVTKMLIIKIIAVMVAYIITYRIIYIFTQLYIFKIWQAILFILIFPIIINFGLKRFNVQKEDITIFFR